MFMVSWTQMIDSQPLGSKRGMLKRSRHHDNSTKQTYRVTLKPQPISIDLASSAAVASILNNVATSLIIPFSFELLKSSFFLCLCCLVVIRTRSSITEDLIVGERPSA